MIIIYILTRDHVWTQDKQERERAKEKEKKRRRTRSRRVGGTYFTSRRSRE